MKRLAACLAVCLALCLALPCALAERSYLIPDSDTRRLTKSELWQWDYESLGYIMNEIFARHGYNFIPGQKYDNYFRCMPWYTPNENSNNQEACYPQLTTVEWYNESLVKEVRKEMKAANTYNKGGRSVWDYFSEGFDTLQGFEFVRLKPNQSLAVYSAPDSESWRGANGKATVSTNGNVFAAGWESGWLLVMYETNHASVRVGYVNSDNIKGSVSVNTRLNFDYQDAAITRNCTLTDDPARTNSPITKLSAGSKVTYLTTYFNSSPWAYVETTVEGKLARGFVPANCLDVAQVEEQTELETK